jgi:integrase
MAKRVTSGEGKRKKRANGEGTIFQRKDGIWAAEMPMGWVNGKRKTKTVYGKTQAEAARKKAKLQSDVQRGLPIPTGRQTVAQFLTDWLGTVGKRRLRPSTYDGYERVVRLHIIPAIGKIQLTKLTSDDLSRLYTALLDKGLAARYVQLAHAVIHCALETAVKRGHIARNHADYSDPPRPKRPEIRPLTQEQGQTFIAGAQQDRDYALYVLAIMTGMRQGELLGLRWGDIDWDSGELHVRRSVGRTSAGMQFSEPKTAKSRRTISLSDIEIAALRRHEIAQFEERRAAGSRWEDHDLVFPNTLGKPVERQNLQQRSFKPLLQRAGLPDIRFHDLRHSAATFLLVLGVHPKVVQERLGHTTIGTTMDIYSHVMPQMQRDAAGKLAAMLAAK